MAKRNESDFEIVEAVVESDIKMPLLLNNNNQFD